MTTEQLKIAIDAWLSSEDRNLDAGALLLLQANRNKVLFQNIIRKRLAEKLRRELEKYSEILARKAEVDEFKKLTDKQVRAMTKRSAGITHEVIEQGTAKGKREDHEQLPDEAKAAFEENIELYHRLRSLHEKLKLMCNDKPCDRYPFLKDLLAADDSIRANWKLYDAAMPVTPANDDAPPKETTGAATTTPPMTAKEISAARKYLSENKKKLPGLKESDPDKYVALLAKMQEKYDALAAAGETFSDEHLDELKALGIIAAPATD